MCHRTIHRRLSLMFSVIALASASLSALAKDATMTFTTPSNRHDTTVSVKFNGTYHDASVVIPPNTTVKQKRDLIRDAVKAANPNLTIEDVGDDGFTIKSIHDNTRVTFNPGDTGEAKDKISCAAAGLGVDSFVGTFSPFDSDGGVAVFTAGFVTDLGELQASVTAEELQFQTDGPIICQALFQRLAPRAPQYGAEINFAGDRLEVYFDPAYSIEVSGIVFGTTSQSEGCSGSLDLGQTPGYHVEIDGSCPGIVNLHWSGAEPNKQQGIVYAHNTGSFVIPNGPCQGTQLGLGTSRLQLYATIGTASGSGVISAQVAPTACGGYVQLITLPSCATSDVAPVP